MFTTYPENYESLYSELMYNYSIASESGLDATEERDITLYIVDSTTDDILGVKKFYSTSSAELNIAPIVRSYAYPEVVVGESGFVTTSNCGSIEIKIIDDLDTESPSRRYTLSRSDESELGLLSSLPAMARIMSLYESEQLTFRVDPEQAVTIVQRQYAQEAAEAVATQTYTIEAQESGLVTFNIVAEPLGDNSLDGLELSVSQGDEIIAELRYIVVETPVDPIRLAWISSRGSIEHYTFPVVTQRSYEPDSSSITVASAYETYAIRRALAEIVESPRVWIAIDTGGYLEVNIDSESVELAKMSDIGSVELKISYCDE